MRLCGLHAGKVKADCSQPPENQPKSPETTAKNTAKMHAKKHRKKTPEKTLKCVRQFAIILKRWGRIPEWPKGADCKSVAFRFDGSNPSSPTSINPHIFVRYVGFIYVFDPLIDPLGLFLKQKTGASFMRFPGLFSFWRLFVLRPLR